MRKTAVFILLLILGLGLGIKQVLAQSARSGSVITQVGEPKEARPADLPQNEGGATTSGPVSKSGLAFYCQGDLRWQEAPCHDIAGGGCGPTSMAMALSVLGSTMTPLDVDKSFQKYNPGLRGCGDAGSLMTTAITGGWLAEQGYSYETICVSCSADAFLKGVKQFTDKGYAVITSQQGWRCPKNCRVGTANHILVVDGANVETREVNVRDPLNCGWKNGDANESTSGGFKRSADEGSWYYAFAIKRG